MIIQVAKLMNTTNPNLEQDVDDLFNLEKSLAIVIALKKQIYSNNLIANNQFRTR